MNLDIRAATRADVEACGRIIYEAFQGIAEQHRFPPDFPSNEAATQLASLFIEHPDIFGVVAESDGEVVGSNFLDERDPVREARPDLEHDRRRRGRRRISRSPGS